MIDWKALMENISYPFLVAGLQEFDHPLAGNQGARIVVHPPGSLALPSVEGFDVPPSFSTSIGVTFHKTINLGEPFGKCSTTDPRQPDNETYRLLPCLQRCMQAEVIQICGCVDASLPLPKGYTVQDRHGVPYCGYRKSLPAGCEYIPGQRTPIRCLDPIKQMVENIKCGKDVQKQMKRQESLMENCGCFSPCEDIKYQVQYSLSGWPPGPEIDSIYMELMADFTNKLMASNPSKIKLDLYAKHFSWANRHEGLKDISKINVYIADTSIVKTVQSAEYTSGDLLSDVGG